MDSISPFMALVQDPDGLVKTQLERLENRSPALYAYASSLMSGWSQARRATLAACLSLLDRIPPANDFTILAAAKCREPLESESDRMTTRVRMHYSCLCFVLLENQNERTAVDMAFSRIHRAVRQYEKPPRF